MHMLQFSVQEKKYSEILQPLAVVKIFSQLYFNIQSLDFIIESTKEEAST